MHAQPVSGSPSEERLFDFATYKRTRWFTTPWANEVHGWVFPHDTEPMGLFRVTDEELNKAIMLAIADEQLP